MFELLPGFCARPFWRAQTLNKHIIGSGYKSILANTAFNPVSKVTAYTQCFV